jgi:hypothetical protein
MSKIKITDENTASLKDNEIFVFGSNLAGRHGAGAAKLAAEKFGAEMGIGEGLTGRCYAFPTKDKYIQTLPLSSIINSAEKLFEVVKNNSDKKFIITAVGCGLAGYTANEIAPIFERFIHLDNVSLPKSFIDTIFPSEFKGYKVTDENMRCRGFQFELNKEYDCGGDVKICKMGFHFCKKLSNCFNYYSFNPSNRVFEVIGTGNFDFETDKVCFEKIRFIRELNWYEVLELSNSGNWNSGHSNSGNWNSGNRNSGDDNSGNGNSGDGNSGNWNSGNGNSGNGNSGNWNSGNGNSGNWNSGHSNSGNWNSGNRNSGDDNSGNGNSGDGNSGNWNSGNGNSGYFNTINGKVRIFNIQTDIEFNDFDIPEISLPINTWIDELTEIEKEENPSYSTTGGYLKKLTYKESGDFWESLWVFPSKFG